MTAKMLSVSFSDLDSVLHIEIYMYACVYIIYTI